MDGNVQRVITLKIGATDKFMNRKEKLTAILERLDAKGVGIDGEHISGMMIAGYLDDLQRLGLIESAFSITSSGKDIKAVCEEFDWRPDDEEIKAFVMEMVDAPERVAFMYMIKKYRDDKSGLLEDFEKAKQQSGGDPTIFES